MNTITPEGGWGHIPTPEQGLQPGPRYAYDLSFVQPVYQNTPPRGSWVEDLQAMGGKQARQLTFGATFGATSGFYLARFLVGLVKLGVLFGLLCAVLVGLSLLGHHYSSQSTPVATTPAAVSITRIRPVAASIAQKEPNYAAIMQEENTITLSPDNPWRSEGNYSGWSMRKAAIAHREFLNEQMEWEIMNSH